jgi:hypothetical protein
VLQIYYEQPFKKPLPSFEAKLLRGAVNLTIKDGGTPHDAGTRFMAAYGETIIGRGGSLEEIKWFTFLGRMWAIRDRMRHWDEHMRNVKLVDKMVKDQLAQQTA